MEEDVLQALLTHWIGTLWSVRVKWALRSIIESSGLWKGKTRLSEAEKRRWKYFDYLQIGDHNENSVEEIRMKNYLEHFFLAPLPNNSFEDAGGYEEDEATNNDDSSIPTKMSPKDIKQHHLRTLTTEAIVRREFDGEVAVVQSDFQWFAPALSHSTIFAVLRFAGFQQEWIDFFRKFLEPPLDMLTGEPVRTRKRGLPMGHIIEKFIGELLLFFMDLAVNEETGMTLYRFHDDMWLWGQPELCAKAWKTMETFADVMGLKFNKNKTGSVYLVDPKRDGHRKPEIAKALPEGPVEMYFLVLDPDSGEWVINEDHVNQHVKQLQRQLGGCKSILEWIRTWNSCIGRFFSYTFAE